MSDRATSVLVTAAGAEGTPGKILALRGAGHRVVAVDIDPRAPGLFLADRAHVVPPGTSPSFISAITRICEIEDIKAIVPLVDEELVPIWALAGWGVQILLPRAELVALCLDKLALMEKLRDDGVPVPRTRSAAHEVGDLSFPLIVKPRSGRGSRGISVVRDRAELDAVLRSHGEHVGGFIVQEYVQGPEYSVSVVVWRDRVVQAVVSKEVYFKEGSSRYAVTRHDAALTEVCIKTAHALDADGPLNVQARVDSSGTPYVFEINPRFSGSATLTVQAGVDEICGLVAQALNGGTPVVRNTWREGVAMIRHATETFVTEPDFSRNYWSLQQNG
ncbi:ATP-grasp domain-containing protein [Nocardiopsis sp. NPDC006139]|uniref:ATP-grasp domain-containing protein n=1 Tax=Nocardiopsis sp. NPDC006139 TaxID=3154578 RepID=UPI00339F227F